MIETVQRDIDGHAVAVSQLPAMKSLRILTRLGKLFGPALTKAIAGLDTKDLKSITSADLRVVGAGFVELFTSVSEDEVEKLARDLLAAATLDGANFLTVMDVQLAGKPLTFLKILVFAVQVNYQSFFDALPAIGSMIPKVAGGEVAKSTSPKA